MVPIRENLLSSAKYNLKVPVESCAKDMKYIVVHNTANDASAANEVAYMIRNDSSTSFNAAVDDKEIVIGIPLSRGAFAAGQRDGNAHGIHIEICYSLSGGTRFDKAEKNAAEYIAKLLTERKWNISHVKKHQDFDGKYCPHRTLYKGWQRFLNMVKSYMGDANPVEPVEVVGYTAQVNAPSGLNVRKNPGTSYPVLRVLPNGTTVSVTKEQDGWLFIGDGWVSGEWVKKSAAPAFEPYTVRATCDVLNIRKGPGTSYPVTGQIKDKKRYTIVSESAGPGSSKGWGKLKSGVGWIAKDWVEKA